jgi:leucyl aminopeptidase
MIDIATLTGACVVALGEEIAGIFSNDDDMASELIESGKSGCELLWRLPVSDQFREELKSPEADIKSIGKSRYGGASVAAAFLSYFVEDGIKWSHLDIAGPGMLTSESGYRNMRGPGFGVETVSNYLRLVEKKLH